jgi:hypothetical protein
LPRLQKLIEQYKNRPDVQFVTLNMDENPGAIEPFLKEHNLELTVLPAYSYVEDTLKVMGIPQNWIVDASGVIRLKGVGYDATAKWETGMTEAIEKNKPAGSAGSGIELAKGRGASNLALKVIENPDLSGGEGEIRTPGTRKGSTVFETAAIDHSATSPQQTSF